MSTNASLNHGFKFGIPHHAAMHGDFSIHSTPTSHIKIRKHKPNDNPYNVFVASRDPRVTQTVQDVADKTLDPVQAIMVGYDLAGIQPSYSFTYPDGRIKQYTY